MPHVDQEVLEEDSDNGLDHIHSSGEIQVNRNIFSEPFFKFEAEGCHVVSLRATGLLLAKLGSVHDILFVIH